MNIYLTYEKMGAEEWEVLLEHRFGTVLEVSAVLMRLLAFSIAMGEEARYTIYIVEKDKDNVELRSDRTT